MSAGMMYRLLAYPAGSRALHRTIRGAHHAARAHANCDRALVDATRDEAIMRGSLKQRYKGSWSIILDLGYEPHPETGKMRRRQKWVTFRGTRKKAEAKLTELLGAVDKGEFVEPSKMTLSKWLAEWLEASVKPRVRPSTYVRYKGIIENDISKAAIASLPLQKIRPTHLEAYYAEARKTLSASTVTLHHAILHRSLRKAVKDRLVTMNVAVDLDGKPRREQTSREDARKHAWTASEARTFLSPAKSAGAQPAAFYAPALDSGARKGELCGLRWSEVDLEAGKIRIVQQLTTPGPEPVFGPPKTGRSRTVTIAAETVELLKAHKKHQAEVKMANRATYKDFGLVFAKEWGDVRTHVDCIGQPLQANNLGQREYAKLIKAADVRAIKFHGLRHTCATLLLQAGQPVHVVSERLGHSKVSMTMEVYAHVLPDMQRDAAARIGALLHG
jgi:integrase